MQSTKHAALVLAFGKTPRDLGVPGEEKLKGKGVSYCTICDGPLFRKKVVAVAGSGDPAIDAATLLSGLTEKVYLVHSGDKPFGDEQILTDLKKKPNVEFVPSSRIVEILGERNVTAVLVENTGNKERREIRVDGLFVEMGYVAKTEFVKDLVLLNNRNEIEVDELCHIASRNLRCRGRDKCALQAGSNLRWPRSNRSTIRIQLHTATQRRLHCPS